MNSLLRYAGAFVLLIVLQLLIFNNIEFSGYVNPFVYVMFILILPVSIPSWILLLLSFLTGFVVDLFSGTMGVHVFATVMAGFVRPWILSVNVTSETVEAEMSPSSYRSGLRWFFVYTVTVVLVHHLALFFVEIFSLRNFLHTLLRVVLSTAVTTFFIVLFDFFRPHR
ncbi:MAG: rod shape-determining protein MreD [Bacteroidales bacterium]|nr:rod shape-determining protein MreD [Bacteroidales bacterium]MDD3737363.1 rod shape-determining protein MreD [Bacteroidales bacterium]NLD64695.1 rod shape-determining protein MreD [Bacteroidales bacterium]HOO67458.1 rod shape-determining protein MreD [Bacteroidales bacterium]HPE23384.1 rod shape-determining protein MreD [Bacteroidales bacterium]